VQETKPEKSSKLWVDFRYFYSPTIAKTQKAQTGPDIRSVYTEGTRPEEEGVGKVASGTSG